MQASRNTTRFERTLTRCSLMQVTASMVHQQHTHVTAEYLKYAVLEEVAAEQGALRAGSPLRQLSPSAKPQLRQVRTEIQRL